MGEVDMIGGEKRRAMRERLEKVEVERRRG